MTSRAYAFPRIDVREAPARSPGGNAQWAMEWAAALKRAASIREIPSAYQLPERTPRTAGLQSVVTERRRKGEIFEP